MCMKKEIGYTNLEIISMTIWNETSPMYNKTWKDYNVLDILSNSYYSPFKKEVVGYAMDDDYSYTCYEPQKVLGGESIIGIK